MARLVARMRFLPLVTLAALLLAGCGGGGPDVPKTADQAVLRVVNAIAENKPVAIWDALPESYQKDVHELVHSAIGKVDATLWDSVVGTATKVTKVLREKKEFILAHPMSGQIPNKAEVAKQWDQIVAVLDSVLTSELSSHEKAKAIHVGKFLDKTGSKVMGDAANFARAAGGAGEAPGEANEWSEMLEKLKKIKATLVKEEGDKATVKMETPGEEAKDVVFVRVEGKWLPEDMVKEWKNMIADGKKEIAAMKKEDMDQAKQMMIPLLGMVDGVVGTLDKAKTQEEFNSAINGLMQMLGGGGPGPAPVPLPSDDAPEKN